MLCNGSNSGSEFDGVALGLPVNAVTVNEGTAGENVADLVGPSAEGVRTSVEVYVGD